MFGGLRVVAIRVGREAKAKRKKVAVSLYKSKPTPRTRSRVACVVCRARARGARQEEGRRGGRRGGARAGLVLFSKQQRSSAPRTARRASPPKTHKTHTAPRARMHDAGGWWVGVCVHECVWGDFMCVLRGRSCMHQWVRCCAKRARGGGLVITSNQMNAGTESKTTCWVFLLCV